MCVAGHTCASALDNDLVRWFERCRKLRYDRPATQVIDRFAEAPQLILSADLPCSASQAFPEPVTSQPAEVSTARPPLFPKVEPGLLLAPHPAS